MINAIIEILALLIVAGIIAVYFTTRYWRAHYNQRLLEKEGEANQLNEQLQSLNRQIAQLKTDLESARKEAEKPASKPKEDDSKANKLAEENKKLISELQEAHEEIEAYEREIDELNDELTKKKASYYKQIEGKKYKAATLRMADEAIAGQGDGRISKADAEQIFATISDGQSYTPVEKITLRYLRDNYRWTPEADELFRFKVRSWAAKGHHLE